MILPIGHDDRLCRVHRLVYERAVKIRLLVGWMLLTWSRLLYLQKLI